MKVLIVSKTKMHNNSCVGGILLPTNEFVRLLDANGNNQPLNTNLNIRDVWEIEFSKKPNTQPPHIEDILVKSYSDRHVLKKDISMLDFLIKRKISYWEGAIDIIFDGLLHWTGNGSGYVNNTNQLPQNSVGFWIPDSDLLKVESNGIRYFYSSSYDKKIKYVGFEQPTEVIKSGTLVRLSLARWWAPPDTDIEERCYLQLSGWY